MKTYAFIFARGGSKGIPRKNIRYLAGKPLIAYSIEAGLNSRLIHRVFVSTDDPEIADVARRYGAEVPFMRPPELAQDDSPEWAAWQHAVREIEGLDGLPSMDFFVCLPTTAPLRSVEDVEKCILTMTEGDADVVITVKNASRHPAFNMVAVDSRSHAKLVMESGETYHHRQKAPAVYDMTTVAYVAIPRFILQATSIFDGRVKAVIVPEERGIDIDTELDFAFAEFLLKDRSMFSKGQGR